MEIVIRTVLTTAQMEKWLEAYKGEASSKGSFSLAYHMPTYIFDDVFGDQRPGSNSTLPVYLPPKGHWDPVHGTCSQCTMNTNIPIMVDTAQVMNGTWHTTTVNPGDQMKNISITFTGKHAMARKLGNQSDL